MSPVTQLLNLLVCLSFQWTPLRLRNHILLNTFQFRPHLAFGYSALVSLPDPCSPSGLPGPGSPPLSLSNIQPLHVAPPGTPVSPTFCLGPTHSSDLQVSFHTFPVVLGI